MNRTRGFTDCGYFFAFSFGIQKNVIRDIKRRFDKTKGCAEFLHILFDVCLGYAFASSR